MISVRFGLNHLGRRITSLSSRQGKTIRWWTSQIFVSNLILSNLSPVFMSFKDPANPRLLGRFLQKLLARVRKHHRKSSKQRRVQLLVRVREHHRNKSKKRMVRRSNYHLQTALQHLVKLRFSPEWELERIL